MTAETTAKEKPTDRPRGLSVRARLLASFVLVLTVPLIVVMLLGDPSFEDAATVFVVALAIGLLLAVILSGSFVHPVRELSALARRVAGGELGARSDLRTSDEFGELAAAFNTLSETLRARITEADASRDEVRDSVRRLGEALRSTHDLKKMLAVVLETALVAVQGRSGAVYLLSARRTELNLYVGRHLVVVEPDKKILLGHGMVGTVAQTKKALRFPGGGVVPIDPEPIERAALVVPLQTQTQLIGVLAIYGTNDGEPFSESDAEAISSLAHQAGIGVENVLLHQEAQRLSITDGLTGIWNYRYFQMSLSQEFERAIRFQRSLSLLVIDIDHFKNVNDRFGHKRGNSILIDLARRVVGHVRMKVDTLARYGGEEFILILPETGLDGARVAAEKIRAEVAAAPFEGEDEEPINVTISVGYAVYPGHGLTQQVLLQAADQAMYEAKARGRNQVVGFEEIQPSATLARDPARP